MNKVLIAMLVGVLAAGPAIADDQTGILAAVQKMVDGFNKGDAALFLGACDKETAIVDEVPPHEWHGAGACAQWMKDYGAFVEKDHIEDAVTTLGRPHRVQVSGDYAYVVMSAICEYKQHGKPVHEDVIVTLALHKVDTQWRMRGWVWARL